MRAVFKEIYSETNFTQTSNLQEEKKFWDCDLCLWAVLVFTAVGMVP